VCLKCVPGPSQGFPNAFDMAAAHSCQYKEILVFGQKEPVVSTEHTHRLVNTLIHPLLRYCSSPPTLSHEDAIKESRYYVVLEATLIALSVHASTSFDVATAGMGARCDLPGSFRGAEAAQIPFESGHDDPVPVQSRGGDGEVVEIIQGSPLPCREDG
jgi:hypothetical protein